MHRTLFYLLITLFPTQLGFHLWPQWAFVLGRRVDYLSPTLFLTDVILIFMLVAWMIELLMKRKQKIWALHFNVSLIALAGMCVSAGINIVFSRQPMVSAYQWVRVFEYGLLGYYIVKTRPPAATTLFFLALSVIYSALMAIGQFILQRSIGGPLWLLGERSFTVDTPGIARAVIGGNERLRSYATFPHPNVLGGFLAIVLPFLWHRLSVAAKDRRLTHWCLGAFFVGVIALFLTFSRSAWVVFAISLGVWFMVSKKGNALGITAVAGILIFFLVFVIPIKPTDESVVVRTQLNAAAFHMWQSAPIFGVGLGNFLVALPSYLPSRTIYFLQPVHNVYLLWLSEIGIAGIASIAAIVIVWGRRQFFTGKRRITPMHVVPILSVALLGVVDHYPATVQQGRLLMTLCVALVVSAMTVSSPPRN